MLRLSAVSLLVFAALAYHARTQAISGWDRETVDYFDRRYYDFGALRLLAEVLVYLGLVAGAAIALAFLVVLARRGLGRQAVFWGLAVAGPIVFTPVLKWLVGRPQIGANPEGDYSFPSGNAMVSCAFVAALLLLLPRFRRVALFPAVVLACAYGAALVLLLWHYPSDVVGGWCMALAWVTGAWIALHAPVVRDLALRNGSPVSATRK
jgi:membrane-associated phospholipid phosphatase